MGVEAVGAYFFTLREMSRPRVTRETLADMVGTSDVTIGRIERGEQEPKAALLARLVQALQGNIQHVYDLLLKPDATEEDGKRIAEAWLLEQVSRTIDHSTQPALTVWYLQRLIYWTEQGKSLQEAMHRASTEEPPPELLDSASPKPGGNEP